MILIHHYGGTFHRNAASCRILPGIGPARYKFVVLMTLPNGVTRRKERNKMRSTLWYARGVMDRYHEGRIVK